LRERPEDIALLAANFGHDMTRELGHEVFRGFTPAALDRLLAHRWPGNVRELKNVVERSLYRWPRADAPIDDIVFDAFDSPHRPAVPAAPTAAPAPPPAAEPAAPSNFLGRVSAYEQKLLGEALAMNQFNQRRSAGALGLTYDQLRHYLMKHALRAALTSGPGVGSRQP
jgi:psp operon transcriptional activator